MKCVDNGKNYLDKKQFVGLLIMDLSKTFDCLPHGFILAKLHAYGVTTVACELLFSYLHERKQRVKIHHPEMTVQHYPKGYHKDSF